MNDVREWLKQADPVAREAPLTEEDAQRMRRVVLAAVNEPPPFVTWRNSVWAAATITVALAAAVGVSRVWRAEGEIVVQSGAAAPTQRVEPNNRRQLQFATRGGTRVIWVFNPEFEP